MGLGGWNAKENGETHAGKEVVYDGLCRRMCNKAEMQALKIRKSVKELLEVWQQLFRIGDNRCPLELRNLSPCDFPEMGKDRDGIKEIATRES